MHELTLSEAVSHTSHMLVKQSADMLVLMIKACFTAGRYTLDDTDTYEPTMDECVAPAMF
jgi:hypothetical protein